MSAAKQPSATASKPRVVKDYDKLDEAVAEQIKLQYPHGFRRNLITFKNAQGDTVSALPFETDDRYYLVRMTVKQAQQIIAEDDDYDEDGRLRPKVRQAYEDKYGDEDDDEDADGDDAALDLDLDDDGADGYEDDAADDVGGPTFVDPNDVADELADNR